MQGLRSFPKSPLARHPRLLVRKIAARLGVYREDVPPPAPGVAAVKLPAHWEPALRRWTSEVPWRAGPHPFGRVFGQDFDETELLRLCREGPRGAGLTGDIKLIWDYSRGQPLFTNAAASGEHLAACEQFLRRWLEANGDLNGHAWACAMEIAIRAVNWTFADALGRGELGRRFGDAPWAAWLWRHGWLIWRRLESRLVPSNHYLADLLGLIVVGAIFPEDAPARGWLRFARKEFPRALLAQTRADGGLNEASLRYHAFVTEMALLARLAGGAAWPAEADARLRTMCRIVAEFRDASGDVFAFGDDDSGRVLAADFASTMGRADTLLRLATVVLGEEFKPSAEALCPESGWWARRAGEFTAAVEFGGVGMRGKGSHAHDDDLSFALEWRGQPVVVDPGTFLYTGDPVARNQFRSAFRHNSIIVDDEERFMGRSLFALPGRDEAWPTRPAGEQGRGFTRALEDGGTHRREVTVRPDEVLVRDVIEGTGSRRLHWRFHLHPSVIAQTSDRGFLLSVPGAGPLAISGGTEKVRLNLSPTEYSPGYGLKSPSVACVAEGEFSLPAAVEWKFQPSD